MSCVDHEIGKNIHILKNEHKHLPPFLERTTILTPPYPHTFYPDGTLNLQHTVKGPTVAYYPHSDEAVLLYTGKTARLKGDPRDIKRYNIFSAKTKDNWQSLIYFDETGENVSPHENNIKPIIQSSDVSGYLSTNGLDDPRICPFSLDNTIVYFITTNALNLKEVSASKNEIGKNTREAIRGSSIELFISSDLKDPQTYSSFGFIGPNEYFRNVVIHPAPIVIDDEPNIMFIGRKFPGIQGYLIPLSDFIKLRDPEFREVFWKNQLSVERIKANTIINPIYDWEGFGNQYVPEGQIAPGPAPFEVSYSDQRTGNKNTFWLFIYNGAPHFDEQRHGIGRKIGAALLEYNNPYHVVARSPVPIIESILPETRDHGPAFNTTFATGGYVDNNNTINVFYTAGDKTIRMASCPMDQMVQYLLQYSINNDV